MKKRHIVAGALALGALAVVLWSNRLGTDNHAPHIEGHFQPEGGTPFGGPTPRADGYTVSSSGVANYLPVFKPTRPMDIHPPEMVKANTGINTCFWMSPRARTGIFSTDTHDMSVENQFPDTGNTYNITFLKIPEGAKVVLKGQFPHARHWNFLTYDGEGIPLDGVRDFEVEPESGSSNPFRDGVRRDLDKRDYVVTLLNGDPPADPAQHPANTLYTRHVANYDSSLWMRSYVVDQSKDLYGQVGLPQMELHLADGRVLTGQAACDATNSPTRGARGKQIPPNVNPKIWLALTHLPGNNPMVAPALPFEVAPLNVFWNRQHMIAKEFFPFLPSAWLAEHKGGFWSNRDTRYGYRIVNQQHGKVLALRGQMPTTPPTWQGDGAPMAKSDMRYWSVCTTMAPATGLTVDCLFDEQVKPAIDAKHRFTVLISREADRPANATDKCGVAWIEWGNGDGMVGGSPDFGSIINRHTLPSKDFQHSWFAVKREGGEVEALGDYLPYLVNYHDKAEFEKLGCPIDTNKIDARISSAPKLP